MLITIHAQSKYLQYHIDKDIKQTIYDTVEQIRKLYLDKEYQPTYGQKINCSLKSLINLHNTNGIQSVSRIKEMSKKISCGEDILEPDGFPNIKLIRVSNDEILVFDGHHTVLAYLLAGRNVLEQTPYLFVEDDNHSSVAAHECKAFYGNHADSVHDDEWIRTTINWQAPKQKQLNPREQKTIGELLNSLVDQL